MARTPTQIPKKAVDRWAAGDEAEAERLSGLKSRQLRNRLGPPGQGHATKVAAPPAPAPAPTVATVAPLPQGGAATSTKPDLLELLRRIGRARNAAAWAEVEEGLLEHQRGGDAALDPWLARPVEAVEVGVDELAALSNALDLAAELAKRAEPGGPALRALSQVASLGKSVATVRARRPAEPKPDAVQEALRAAAGECVEHLMRHHAAAEEEWSALLVELRTVLGYAAPPLLQRLDGLLGAPA